MKVRCDFVTNSSSSSFIISRKKELTQKQKDAIVEYVTQTLLGEHEITKENFESVCDDYYFDEDQQEEIRKELDKGNAVYCGRVYFEFPEEDIAEIYCGLWDAVECADPEHFTAIDTDLSY